MKKALNIIITTLNARRPHSLSFLRDESETDCSIKTEQIGEEIKETIWLFEGAQK